MDATHTSTECSLPGRITMQLTSVRQITKQLCVCVHVRRQVRASRLSTQTFSLQFSLENISRQSTPQLIPLSVKAIKLLDY